MFKQIKEDMQSVFNKAPATRNMAEILINYPGIHAVALHRLAHALWIKKLRLLARMIASFSRLFTGIEIINLLLVGNAGKQQ